MADDDLNSTSAALLGLLHEGPMTGGDLVARARSRLAGFWTLTRSQVYRELPALADRGYVKLGKPGARQSQPYTITANGKRAFKRWLAEPQGRDAARNPLLLRLSFGTQHSTQQLKSLLSEARAEHEERLAEYRAESKRLSDGSDEFARATVEFGISYEKALLKWMDALPAQWAAG